jgi:hypothetical protein
MPKNYKGVLFDYNTYTQQDTSETQNVCLNQSEIFLLLSQLDTMTWRTRWIGLPDNENLEFVEELINKLTISSSDCDCVVDCIESNAGSVTTIVNEENTGTGGDNATTVDYGGGNFNTNGCDYDYVYNACKELVAYMIRTIRDTLEIIEASTNFLEIVANWLDNFFDVPNMIQAVLDWINYVEDNIIEVFEAQLTQALEDEYICDLFCMYIDGCQRLTPRQISQYFLDRLGGSSNLFDNLIDFLVFLVDGSWSGSAVVDFMMVSCIGVMQTDENAIPFLTIPTTYTLQHIFNLAGNTPDSDWQILCSDCQLPWYWVIGQWGEQTEPTWNTFICQGTSAGLASRRYEGECSDGGNVEVVNYEAIDVSGVTWYNLLADGNRTNQPPTIGVCYEKIDVVKPNGNFEFKLAIKRTSTCK